MPFQGDYALPAITPTMSPQDSQAKILSLANAVQQGQLGAQALKTGELDLQMKKRALDDENRYRQIVMANSNGGGSQPQDDPGPDAPAPTEAPQGTPAAGSAPAATAPGTGIALHTFDVAKTVDDLRKAGLHTHADALANTALEQQVKLATAGRDLAQAQEFQQNTATKKLETKNHALFASTGYMMSVPPEQRAAVFPHVMQTLIAAGVEDPKLAGMTYEQFGGDEALTRAHEIAGTQVEKDAEAAAKRDKDLAPSKLKQSEADAGLAQHKLDLIKNAKPEDYEALVDQIAPGKADAVLNKRTKAEVRFYVSKGDIESAQKALTAAANQIGEISKETDPRVIGAHISQAVGTAKATEGIDIDKAVKTHLAIAKLSPDAFAGIGNTTSQNAAMNEADKIYKEYTDKSSTNQMFIDTLNGARTNPALAATLPMQEVKQFFGRANQQELKSVSSGVGSLLQRADTYFAKGATGTPPDWLINDTLELAKIQQKAARRNFDAGRDRLKMRGVDVSKLPEPNLGGSAAPGVVTWTRDANGNPVPSSGK